MEYGGWELVIPLIGGGNGVIPLIGGGNGGSRLRGDWDIRHEEAEYGCAVYCCEISVFSTWFGLMKIGRLSLGSSKDSRTKDSGWRCNQIIQIKWGHYSILYWNTPLSSISNSVLYPRSGLGRRIFVLGSIRFNRESTDSRLLHLWWLSDV